MRTSTTWCAVAGVAAGLAGPATVRAQERPTSTTDSLIAEVHALNARLDSLAWLVDSLRTARADTLEVVDELAALRAAAAAAGEQADTTAAEGTQGGPPVGSLNRLNPEISITGDVRLAAVRPGPQADNVDLREFEFAFQAALDPYASTKIFLSFEEGELDLEEGYAYWSGLPGGFRVDLGRLRQQVGDLNRVHLHALPESEYPLVYRTYFGEEGLVGNGLRVYWLAPFDGPGGATHELWGELTVGESEELFQKGDRLSVLGHLNNFWQLGRSSFFQVGGTVAYGENPDEELKARLFGADLRYTWRPPGRGLYRSFTLRGEAYAVHQERGGIGGTRYGAYLGAEYQLGRSWFAGARFDYVELLEGPSGRHEWAIVPRITWWQSEWVMLRAEWQHSSTPDLVGERDTSDRWLIQAVWAVGPHKHESY
ncbi:MAG: hypothetical protein ACE5JR_11305 [Gemmatimonadota bacterium]